jgi:GLPGLI family protein
MKKIFFVFFLLTTISVSAQNMIVNYVSSFPNGKLKTSVIILDDITYNKTEPLSSEPNVIVMEPSKDEKKGFFIKKNSDNKLYFYTRTPFSAERYYVSDSLHPMKWVLTEETKKILGIKCKSATTTFRGRTYKAFYATGISVSNGPWKFGGLPGLILEIASADGECSWVAGEIIKNPKNINVDTVDLTKYKFITWEEYAKEYKDLADKKIALLKAKSASDPNWAGGAFKAGGIEIIYPLIQTGRGFEY